MIHSDSKRHKARTIGGVTPQFFWYIAGVASFVIPAGVQMVLLPWLVIVHLQAGSERLGIAQMSSQLPGLFLILLGGLLADRRDNRLILIRCHLLAAVPAACLAVLAFKGQLQFYLVVIYVMGIGTVTAFVQPARDAVLNRIAGDELQKTVTITMGLTFGAQIIGYLFAGFLDVVGPGLMLSLQSVSLLGGAWLAAKLAPAPPLQTRSDVSILTQLGEGVIQVFASSRMIAALVPMVGVGIFYGGSLVVLNPLIVRQVYAGNAADISLSYVAFMMGTIVTTVILVARGGITNQGRALLVATFMSTFFLGLTWFVLPFPLYLTMISLWGMCGAVVMSMSRTIIQESAPSAYRARALSIFSLANLGGMPVGALMMGYLAAWMGPLNAILVAVAGVCSVCVFAGLATPLISLKRLNIAERRALGAMEQ